MIDLVGKKFGKLVVIQLDHKDKNRKLYWLCRCNCGKEKIIRGNHLKSGNTKSCGCLRKEIISIINTTHGHSQTKTYNSWVSIIKRCTNPKNKSYQDYGGRGIKVCRRWMKLENFLEDMGERPEGYQIDRINNDGNYCKSNCRWVTPKQNSRNRRDNHLETYDGKTQCIVEWSEESGIPERIIQQRLNRGWSIEKALTTLIGKQGKKRKN